MPTTSRRPSRLFSLIVPFLIALVASGTTLPAHAQAEKRALTFVDLMKMRTINDLALADDGSWVAYQAQPDRGDGMVIVRATNGNTEFAIERGASPAMTPDGRFVAARLVPSMAEEHAAKDKGDDEKPKPGAVLMKTADGTTTTWERVQASAFSADGAWLALHHHKAPPADDDASTDGSAETMSAEGATVEEGVAEEETATESAEGEPVEGEPVEGEPVEGEPVEGEVGAGVPTTTESPAEAETEIAVEDEGDEKAEPRLGTTLTLVRLADQTAHELHHVEHFAFDETGRYLAYATAVDPDADDAGGNRDRDEVAGDVGTNGLFVLDLASADAAPQRLHYAIRGRYTALAWAEDVARLGFVAATDDDEGEPGDATVWTWADGDPDAQALVASDAVGDGWRVPSVNDLQWSRDGARLFFGRKPRPEDEDSDDGATDDEDEDTPFDPYDVDAVLADRGVDVWHWNDARIVPNQKQRWEETEKDRHYRVVVHVDSGRVVPLADESLPELASAGDRNNPHAVLGLADTPYLKAITWDGWHHDVYRLSLENGARQVVTKQLRSGDNNASLSPDGRFVAYYRTPHWYLFDGNSGETRNLTEGLDVPFDNEDHDYPQPAPGYGLAGWVSADAGDTNHVSRVGSVLLYDKYDLWSFTVADGTATNVTEGAGRREETLFRLVDLDEERNFLYAGEPLLLTGYRDRAKSWGFYRAHAGTSGVETSGVETLMAGDYKVAFVAKAKDADRLLFTRERYDEFPDLHVTGLDFASPRRLSDLNPQIDEFAWGSAELVSWQSADGLPLDGVLIKPGNYEEGKRYPVLVYYYRFFSQRLHEFNHPAVNHRPSFPLYASNGYVVFLPDVRFEVGRPGPAAVKSLVPGVQKLVDMGVADPDAIGLHGHSWSGYQTAFVVTQTNRFAAAVAGAPVSNMTSAYGGIRWGTGLSRQFQYEQTQSRLGANLWQARDRYIDNSPLFFADRIETPLLLMFGDEDEAVPWYQGIELYMALRRLGKESVFLQYRGEGHHPKQYPNKLDYSIKMKEYFDHYLQGAPTADWMVDGVPYRGE